MYKRQLYDLAKDFSEADDLAAKEPERLARLQRAFDEQALSLIHISEPTRPY